MVSAVASTNLVNVTSISGHLYTLLVYIGGLNMDLYCIYILQNVHSRGKTKLCNCLRQTSVLTSPYL